MASYRVTASALNVRKGPGTSYAKVALLYKGDVVNVQKTSDGWSCIGTSQWVSSTYLTAIEQSDNSGRLAPSYKPTANLENRPIYLMQTDARWKNKMYSIVNNPRQTIGSSGCGPSAASMIVNEWSDPKYGPVEACAWAAAAGYRTADNGTYWSMMKALAVKFGYKFMQTASSAAAVKFLNENKGSLIVCIMGKGNWTSSGHYILMYKCDGKYVYVNDPASTKAARQKNTLALLKSQCHQYFCFAKPGTAAEATTWAPKDKVETITQNAMVVAASVLNVRSEPTTSNGDNIIGTIEEGMLVMATKKCGDWYWISGTKQNGKTVTGWSAASYLNDANIDNVDSDLAAKTGEAINYLVKQGFINTPDYWRNSAFDVGCLTYLFIAIANAIMERSAKAPVDAIDYTAEAAIDALAKAEVINSPDYWKKHVNDIKYLGTLFIKAARWIC